MSSTTLEPGIKTTTTRAGHSNPVSAAGGSGGHGFAEAGIEEYTDFQGCGTGAEYDARQPSLTGVEPHEKSSTVTASAEDWDGPDDPSNPQNWSLPKKVFHSVTIGLFSFAVTAGTSLITPATEMIGSTFGVSSTAALLSLSLYVLGLGLGPMIAAPISETFGRSIVYKTAAPISMLFILGAGFSKSFATLLVCRILAGITSGPVLAIGAASNADMFPPETRSLAISCFIAMGFSGPALGPVIGGFAAQFKGWRWTQWCTIFIDLAVYGLVVMMSETYKKAILKARAKKRGVKGPQQPLNGYDWVRQLVIMTLIRPIHMLCTESTVLFLSLYNSFTFSVLFALFAAYPYTFSKVYNFSTWQTGLTFLGIFIGVQLGVATAVLTDRLIYFKKYLQLRRDGKMAVDPEHRLYNAMMGSFGVTIGYVSRTPDAPLTVTEKLIDNRLFWFAWTSHPSIHWISPVLAGIPFAWGNTAIFSSSTQYLTDVYGPANGASAMAANGIARYTMGAVFPLFTLQMYERLTIPWATSLLAFISLAMIPIPWVFFRCGPRIRRKSAYGIMRT